MFGDLMKKMQEAKAQMEETKMRLETIIVEGQCENGMVVVRANGNRKLTELFIDKYLLDEGDNEALQDLVLLAANRALSAAETLNEKEMQSAAKGMIPDGLDIPGMLK